MRLASLQNITPETRLAQPLLDEKGLVLLNKGVVLSDSLAKRLLNLGITSVYIEDVRTEDVVIEEVISQETRQEALQLVFTTLQSVQTSEQHPRQFYQDLNGRNIRRLFDTVLHEMKGKPNLLLSVSNIYTSDGFLYHHSVNVALMALAIGIEYGLTEKQLLDLGVGTLLHDIGKLRLPQDILNKPGRLTPEEYEIIKQHPMIGYEMLRLQDDISVVSAHVALQHHERVDGTGYPRGIKGEEMHIFGKITAVADVYEALTANRVYRKGQLPHEALELLLGACGTHFDREIVELFLKTVAIYPTGLTVRLNSGETGVIIRQNPTHPQRPVIRVLQDAAGRPVEAYEINLMEHLTTLITACEC
ncbi:putative nucleotidyltransferase with HDIG domain [Tumebacillus sp. BK434]|uniref:HD-GYP domain-containing protein n=1 Tax=Tumebacillus sp. BK434 TaxID=2512169 RepID=UPI00104C1F82|nr:HD-GYP domain-containing protein [Tumebacillus sp. BK434]TCP57682.1 putative nucleotidyltransferase with HDIG domain [Tumebacillus sp. BK434]